MLLINLFRFLFKDTSKNCLLNPNPNQNMKNKFLILTSLAISLASFSVTAEEGRQERNIDVAEHKAKIIAHLNQQKLAIDQEISCINSANKRDDIKNCHEQRKAAMEKLKAQREENMAELKQQREAQKSQRKEKRMETGVDKASSTKE